MEALKIEQDNAQKEINAKGETVKRETAIHILVVILLENSP